jgi:tetratricopeptide (TPR) repeat protein
MMTVVDLTLALNYHQRGLLEPAATVYEELLAEQPDHPDALHLLGALMHQRGDHARALDLIDRAIAVRPGVAAFHANRAEALRALGRLEESSTSCREALRLRPRNPEVLNNLGLVLLAQDHLTDAVEHFGEATRLRPDFALAHNNLGNALRLMGDAEAAMARFREALRIVPGMAEAHTNLGQLLLERKRLDEALPHCQEAVRMRPDFAEAHSNLGNVLREMGRFHEARVAYASALRLNPGIGVIHNNIGQVLQEEGRLDEALTWYHQALKLDPGSARIHGNLASLLAEREDREGAIASYEQALLLDSSLAEAYCGLGGVRHEQGRYDEAQQLYREALRRKPDLAAAHCALGSLLEELSDFDGARACFHEALRHDPRLPGALAQLATMLRGKLPDDDLTAMRRLLDAPYFTDGQRATLQFGLAQVSDARGDFAEAAEHLRIANGTTVVEWRKRGLAYDPAAHRHFVDRLIESFTPEFFERMRGLGHDSERPVFIVGLPRSGTTLTEQILARHPRVFGAGELPLGRADFQLIGRNAGDTTSFARLASLDSELARQVAEVHLDRLRELDECSDRVVDKLPDNYLYLGLLAALFPGAKFIHCRRDPRDIAVSCWMTNFRQIRWSSDFDHIASRFEQYRRLIEHWRSVLPVPVLEVDYERTVADLEGTARRLVDWCGLDWDPACLEFHRGDRPVRTASVAQVRQPIYKRSVARWMSYEPALAPLFARVRPVEDGDSILSA